MSENTTDDNKPSDTNSALGTDELAKAMETIEKQKNDYLYLRAEFENYKRNSIKERSDLSKYGAERFVKDLLEVVDNFERGLAMQVTAENFKTFHQGVEMTAQELRSLLQRHSVVELKADGAPFDPAVHEALSSEETTAVPAGHVFRVFKKPYKLHDKVIRHGQVIVAKAPSETTG